MQIIGMSVADKQVNTQNNLAKAGSSWETRFPRCPCARKDCHGFHFPESIEFPGVQVRGDRPLAQARTGPGMGPGGGAFFNENVDFHKVFKGICYNLRL